MHGRCKFVEAGIRRVLGSGAGHLQVEGTGAGQVQDRCMPGAAHSRA